MKIIIDCGHNHSDTWQKFSPVKDDGSRFYEYQSNRLIGQLLASRLDKLGIKYEYTINPNDKKDMTLGERVNIANEIALKEGKNNVLFLSIHSDAYGNGKDWYDDIIGYSIFSSKGKTKSDEYAKIFEKHYRTELPKFTKCRGHKEEDFFVLRKTICPAILLENGFYTSRKDLEYLDSDEGRNKIVDIIVKSIVEIIESRG